MMESKLQENIKEDGWITLDIGGKIFKTKDTTIRSIPGTLLSSLTEKSEYFDPNTNSYKFDRESSMFKPILALYRTGELHTPRQICPRKFRLELAFWEIPIKTVPSCCWKTLFEAEEEVETLDMIIKSSPNIKEDNKVGVSVENRKDGYPNVQGHVEQVPSLRERVWIFLEEPQRSMAAKVWCFAYIVVVLISVLIHLMWIDEDMRSDPYLYKFVNPYGHIGNSTEGTRTINQKVKRMLFKDPHICLFVIDVMCSAIFIIEAIVHFIVSPDKLRYIQNGNNIIKMVLSPLLVAALITEIRKDLITGINTGKLFLYIKTMNMFRILLILRLRKLYNNFHIILLSMQKSGKELLLLLFVFGSTVLVYAGIMFCVEIEGDMFPNTRTSMWWAIITMTTVGYGDFYPTTTLGYIIGCLCAINGLVVIALPIAAIASNFANICSRNGDYQKYLQAVQNEQMRVLSVNGKDEKVWYDTQQLSNDQINENLILDKDRKLGTDMDTDNSFKSSESKPCSIKQTASSRLKRNVKT